MATILLVDDVELFLELEGSYLEERGHDLLKATTGEEALRLIREADPALVLLDLYLPDIDGDEICRRLRASEGRSKLPVLMVTAGGREEEIRRCLDAGCSDYLTKPVSKSELLEKVDRLLGRVRARMAPRAPIPLRVQLKGGGKALRSWARDLSRNGIYVRSRSVLEPGAAVELRVELPGGERTVILGKVARVQEGPDAGMGIYFVHPDPQGKKALESLLGEADADLAEPLSADLLAPAAPAAQKADGLAEENRRLLARIAELEQENRDFARQVVRTEEVNNSLTNLYVASSRLHSVLHRSQVVEIIKEVVINLVGAEKFALLLLDEQDGRLGFETGEGFTRETFPSVPPGSGLLGEVMNSGENFFQEGPVMAGSDDPLAPLAAVPLKIHGRILGVLAVHRLFIQKERFEPLDYQLFSMLAEHAATALFSSSLYEQSERKRQTYRGVMDLLLK